MIHIDHTMKQKLLVLTILLSGISLAYAQEKKPHFTKKEFRAKQQEYITRKAELTKEEADKFFVLYFELQDKKKKINDRMRNDMHNTRKKDFDEAGYGQIIDKMLDSRMESEKLERCYIQQYKKFLSDKKIFKILTAEMNFHKELLKSMKQNGEQRDTPSLKK